MSSSNISIDIAECLACGRCVDRCIMDNLRLMLPPCRQASPLGINYQGIMRFVSKGEFAEAAKELRRCTPFGGFLSVWGDAWAERACSRGGKGGPLNMKGILALLVRKEPGIIWSSPDDILPDSGRSAAIVGSGPAGLQAAWDLRVRGHAVTVYDANGEIGASLKRARTPGALPAIPAELLEKTIGLLSGMGITFLTSSRINEKQLSDLAEKFDAVILASGSSSQVQADACGQVRDNVFAAGSCLAGVSADTAEKAMAT